MKFEYLSVILFALITCFKAEGAAIEKCGQNEHNSTCGTACEGTCNDVFPKVCTDQCIKGCFCDQGFVRKTKGGPCIPIVDCLETSKPPTCGPNEEYSQCSPSCPNVCSAQRIYFKTCEEACVPGCVCKKGFIKVKKEGVCIPKNSCPRICRADQIYKPYGSICPPTCKYPNPICVTNWTFSTEAPGCFCKEGDVVDEKTNLCIPLSSCPKRQ